MRGNLVGLVLLLLPKVTVSAAELQRVIQRRLEALRHPSRLVGCMGASPSAALLLPFYCQLLRDLIKRKTNQRRSGSGSDWAVWACSSCRGPHPRGIASPRHRAVSETDPSAQRESRGRGPIAGTTRSWPGSSSLLGLDRRHVHQPGPAQCFQRRVARFESREVVYSRRVGLVVS